jgi:anthranilate synthase component 1
VIRSATVESCDTPDGVAGDRTNRTTVQAGAGIVADSVPGAEYEETENKMGGVLDAVERIEASSADEAATEEVSR